MSRASPPDPRPGGRQRVSSAYLPPPARAVPVRQTVPVAFMSPLSRNTDAASTMSRPLASPGSEELEARRKAWKRPPLGCGPRTLLGRYSKYVTDAAHGAVQD